MFRTLAIAGRELPRVLPLFRDERVPLPAKVAAVAAALFVISPLNVLGDLPLLGFFDDAALLLFVAHTFVRFAEERIASLEYAPMKSARPASDTRASGPKVVVPTGTLRP